MLFEPLAVNSTTFMREGALKMLKFAAKTNEQSLCVGERHATWVCR